MAKETFTFCRACGSQIAKSAKVCPHCGAKNKKPIYKRVWFIILAVIVIIGIIGAASGGGDDETAAPAADTGNQTAQTEEKAARGEEPAAESIEYTEVTADQMMSDLDSNAAAAKDTYENQYVAVSGTLGTIDSDGSYFDVMPANDEFAFIGVTCRIQNDEQLDKIKSMSNGDSLTVKGQVTDVGEVLGYTLKIDSIE